MFIRGGKLYVKKIKGTASTTTLPTPPLPVSNPTNTYNNIWGVIYAIVMRHSPPLWQSSGLSCAHTDTAAAQLTNYFIYIKGFKNKCTSSDALFIVFLSPLSDKITQKVINWRGNLCYYYVTVTVLAALNPLGAEWSPLIGGEDVS